MAVLYSFPGFQNFLHLFSGFHADGPFLSLPLGLANTLAIGSGGPPDPEGSEELRLPKHIPGRSLRQDSARGAHPQQPSSRW